MNIFLKQLGIGLLLLQTSLVNAAPMEIRGSISCGYWFSDRLKPEVHHRNTTWLVGYLIAIGWKSNGEILNQTEIQYIELSTDEYCRLHPESYITTGASDLVKALANGKNLQQKLRQFPNQNNVK